jgi:hypothetical protein
MVRKSFRLRNHCQEYFFFRVTKRLVISPTSPTDTPGRYQRG